MDGQAIAQFPSPDAVQWKVLVEFTNWPSMPFNSTIIVKFKAARGSSSLPWFSPSCGKFAVTLSVKSGGRCLTSIAGVIWSTQRPLSCSLPWCIKSNITSKSHVTFQKWYHSSPTFWAYVTFTLMGPCQPESVCASVPEGSPEAYELALCVPALFATRCKTVTPALTMSAVSPIESSSVRRSMVGQLAVASPFEASSAFSKCPWSSLGSLTLARTAWCGSCGSAGWADASGAGGEFASTGCQASPSYQWVPSGDRWA